MIKRIAEKQLLKYLQTNGAVLIVGPKYCGKTFLASQVAKSKIELTEENKAKINISNSYALDGETPRLIDEWQVYPQIWDIVRREIDNRSLENKDGQFILTGSSTPFSTNQVFHSGAGRIIRMNLHTLSFAEILNLPKEKTISLQDLFDKKEIKLVKNDVSFEQVNELLYIGGWPKIIASGQKDVKSNINGYVSSITHMNLDETYNMRISSKSFEALLFSLCRRMGTQLSINSIYNEISNYTSRETAVKLIDVLYDCCTLFDIPVWHNINIRSST